MLVLPANKYPTFVVILVLSVKRHLRDEVKPIVGQSRAELVTLISGRELDIKTGAKGRSMRARRKSMEVPFHSHVGVADSSSIRYLRGAVNGEIRNVEVQFKAMRQSIVHFEVRSILLEIRVFRRLESVEFVKKLKVKHSWVSDLGVICVEGKLSQSRQRIADHEES